MSPKGLFRCIQDLVNVTEVNQGFMVLTWV